MSSTLVELRHVLRKLARSPFFSLVSILTLALGIGANTAIFSVVHGVLLKPLPFDDPERLVGVWHEAPGLNFPLLNQSPAAHLTYREKGTSFTDVGMWDDDQVAVTGLTEPEQVEAMWLTEGTLELLGRQPFLGRTFSPEDAAHEAPKTVILGHGYWQKRFGGDRGVLGRTLSIESQPHEVIGVMPRDFHFLDYDPAVILPFQFDRAKIFMGNFSYQGLARLAPGVTLEQANADVARLIPIAVESFPGGLSLSMLQEARFGPKIRPLKLDAIGDIGPALWVLFGTVGIVLLIACANVANLFLVRAERRQLEIAVRTALGASRGAVARDFLAESLVLGLLGGLGGLALAAVGLEVLRAIGPETLPRLQEITLDGTVLLFTLGISLLSGLLFGLVPALRYGVGGLVGTLKEGGRGGSEGRERHRARNVLVVCQIALALVLLVGSGLMIRTFDALRHVNPGFSREGDVLTVRVSIPEAEIKDPFATFQAYEQIYRNLESLPGVTSLGMTSSIPLSTWNSNDALFVEDFPTPEGQLPPIRRFQWISPGYFETLGIPLLAGRSPTWDEERQMAPVAVLSANLAKELWGSPAAALGKRVRASFGEEGPWREVIGVVGDVHDDGVDQKAPTIVYWPMLLQNFWKEETVLQRSMVYALRHTRGSDPALLTEVEKGIWTVNSNLPLASVRTLDEIFERSMARTSFTLVMLAIAAAVALLLGVVGIYGVTSYVVSLRTREIGIRLALGARQADVRGLVLRHALVLAGIGVGVGLAAAFGLTQLMEALLFGVSAIDPLTYGAVAAGLVGVALLASYVPARRAAQTDPLVALRWE